MNNPGKNEKGGNPRPKPEAGGKGKAPEKPAYNRIKAALAEQKVSNKELAARLGKTPSAVSNWCRNEKQPDLQTLFQIAVAIGVEPTSLINSVKKAGL